MSSRASSTIGFERRFNPAFATTDEQEFVAESVHVSTPRPPTMERVVELNRGPFLGAPSLERRQSSDGATVLDVRQAKVFVRGHLHGAVNIPLRRSGLGTRAGFVFAPDEPIVLHAETAAEAQEAARRLWAVGLLDVHGYLVDVPATETLEPVGVDELERLLAEDAVDVIDVREKAERDAGYIPGSRHIPYRVIRAYGEEAADGKPVVTICESGARATLAASILAAAGIDARPILDGGVRDWQARGHRLVHFRRCGR
jgi:rhodanese-related sulfurtransferase